MRAFGTNTTSSAFTSIIPTITEPTAVNPGESGSGIFNLAPGGCDSIPDAMLVYFFGAGADNDTFDVRLWGWDRIGSVQGTMLWTPSPIASFTCTLSQAVGIAAADIINTDRFVDTIVVNAIAPQPFIPNVNATPAAEYFGTIKINSPANNFRGFAIVPLLGYEKIQFDFDMTGATNGNALFRFLNCDD